MLPTLTPEQRDALRRAAGRLVEVLDQDSAETYVLMPKSEFERLAYDDSELSEEEMVAAASQTTEDLEDSASDAIRGMDANPSGLFIAATSSSSTSPRRLASRPNAGLPS